MQVKILWADDEIDLLKPHILFLESKGYEVITVNNGKEAVELNQKDAFDIIFLDENMPGITGLDALLLIKEDRPLVPVVMITKSEEEHIMEEAIGSKIADYLIKPVNPNQILLTLKKNLDHKKLVSQKTNSVYQQEFRQLGMTLSSNLSYSEWVEVFKKLVYWELELDKIEDKGMKQVFEMQKKEANQLFTKFFINYYSDWLNEESSDDTPLFLHRLMKEKVFKELQEGKVALLVVDNLRYDQWQVIKPIILNYYKLVKDEVACSILPTATHYARNAFFAGMMPIEIEEKLPQYWVGEYDEGAKNGFEKELLEEQLKSLRKEVKWSYQKVTNYEIGKKVVDNFNQIQSNDFNVVVYNFVDMLSHARTEMKVIRELADDEAAYRSITRSWFEHSPLQNLIKKFAESGFKLIITTDHGTIRVNTPIKVLGERDLNTNLRYKFARGMSYKEKDVFLEKDSKVLRLPKGRMSSEYIFAKNDDFFVYPNNYNHFVNHYSETFQHGGVSMEELLIPFIVLQSK